MRRALLRTEPQDQRKVQLCLLRVFCPVLLWHLFPHPPLPGCLRRLPLCPSSGLPQSLTLFRAQACDLSPSPCKHRHPSLACLGGGSPLPTMTTPLVISHKNTYHLPYSLCFHRGTEAQRFAAKTFDQQRSTQWNQFQVDCIDEELIV